MVHRLERLCRLKTFCLWLKESQTCGNFNKIPAVCISSHPSIRRSVSVSASSPSKCDGVELSFSSGKRQFCNVNTIFPYGFTFPALVFFAGAVEFSFVLLILSHGAQTKHKFLSAHGHLTHNRLTFHFLHHHSRPFLSFITLKLRVYLKKHNSRAIQLPETAPLSIFKN